MATAAFFDLLVDGLPPHVLEPVHVGGRRLDQPLWTRAKRVLLLEPHQREELLHALAQGRAFAWLSSHLPRVHSPPHVLDDLVQQGRVDMHVYSLGLVVQGEASKLRARLETAEMSLIALCLMVLGAGRELGGVETSLHDPERFSMQLCDWQPVQPPPTKSSPPGKVGVHKRTIAGPFRAQLGVVAGRLEQRLQFVQKLELGSRNVRTATRVFYLAPKAMGGNFLDVERLLLDDDQKADLKKKFDVTDHWKHGDRSYFVLICEQAWLPRLRKRLDAMVRGLALARRPVPWLLEWSHVAAADDSSLGLLSRVQAMGVDERKAVTHVSLRCCSLEWSIDGDEIRAAVARLPNVRVLDVSCTWVEARSLEWLTGLLPKLEALHVQHTRLSAQPQFAPWLAALSPDLRVRVHADSHAALGEEPFKMWKPE